MHNILFFLLLATALVWTSCNQDPASVQQVDKSHPPTILFLLRHAEKDTTIKQDPPLTEKGQARAELLAGQLSGAGITTIFASDYERTRATAAPLPEELGLDIQLYDAKAAAQDLIPAFITGREGEHLLIVGHSNTVPAMLNSIVGEQRYEQLAEQEYDKLFMVSLSANGEAQVTTLSFEPCE